MPVHGNERGTYIFNSKDLCMIEQIPELIEVRATVQEHTALPTVARP